LASTQILIVSGSPETPVSRLPLRTRSDVPFFVVMSGLSSTFIILIVLMLVANVLFTSTDDIQAALAKPEIQAAFRLTLLSCTIAALLSLWVATPLGYLLSRYRFPGRTVIDTLIEIPIVLPPLVVGLSLLILFHLPFGGEGRWTLDAFLEKSLGFQFTYRWPAVILAQFAVACAFSVRTMHVTFDQINPRAEDVARTLGCSRSQAFLYVALPQAWRGLVTAGTTAWARALGEFGPILVFAGATRMKTEVLSTTVFLELSIGNLNAAVAVSLLMVIMASLVLVILRLIGLRLTT